MNAARLRAAAVMGLLAVAAVVVVVVTLRKDLQTNADYTTNCPDGQVQVVVKPLPRQDQINLKLFNGSGQKGAASTVAESLRHQGLHVAPVSEKDVKPPTGGTAQIYFGPKAFGAAWVMRSYFLMTADSDAEAMHFDVNEKSDVVTIVIGKAFKQLPTPSDVRAAMALLSQPTAPPGTCGVTVG